MWFELVQRIVWYIHGYECFGEVFGSVCTGHQMMEAVEPGQIICAEHFRLHGPITEKTTISNLNIMNFSCIVTLLQKNYLNMLGNT